MSCLEPRFAHEVLQKTKTRFCLLTSKLSKIFGNCNVFVETILKRESLEPCFAAGSNIIVAIEMLRTPFRLTRAYIYIKIICIEPRFVANMDNSGRIQGPRNPISLRTCETYFEIIRFEPRFAPDIATVLCGKNLRTPFHLVLCIKAIAES